MNASELLKKYREGKCTPEELALLETWYLKQEAAQHKQLGLKERKKAILEIQDYLMEHISTHKSEKTGKIKWWYSAAAIFLILAGAYWLAVNEWGSSSTIKLASTLEGTAEPTANKAYLTLSDGRKIVLADEKNGILTEQRGVKISKTANGQLIYENDSSMDTTNKPFTEIETYNIISTPKGAQFAVKLPDGTQVWLNAASSLRYPVHFTKGERRVELVGEAYFDVAKSPSHPFKVVTERPDGSQFLVEVLGTQFNVNAYEEEQIIRTTLIEGRVQTSLTGQDNKVSLKPGQQLLLKNKQMDIVAIDPTDEIAWKEGNFAFKDTEIHEVMRQLARWYDLSVDYKGFSRNEIFTGYVSRDVPLIDVLAMLEKGGGVKFKIIGNKVEVNILK